MSTSSRHAAAEFPRSSTDVAPLQEQEEVAQIQDDLEHTSPSDPASWATSFQASFRSASSASAACSPTGRPRPSASGATVSMQRR